MRNVLSIFIGVLVCAASARAGSGTGGSNPPAIEQSIDTLAFMNSELAPLMTSDSGDFFLGFQGSLSPTLTVAREKSDLADIVLSDADFELLKQAQGTGRGASPIEVINREAKSSLYSIHDGGKVGELILVNTGSLIRSQLDDQ